MHNGNGSSAVAPGLMASMRLLADSLVGNVHDRLQLLGIEVQEEKFRIIQSFLWIAAMVFAGSMAVIFASLALVYLFWESARLAVLGGLALFYALAFLAVLRGFNQWRAQQPEPFAGSLKELAEDRACIRSEN